MPEYWRLNEYTKQLLKTELQRHLPDQLKDIVDFSRIEVANITPEDQSNSKSLSLPQVPE